MVRQLDQVLHRPVIALDLAVGPRVIRTAAGMYHAAFAETLAKLACHIRRTVVAEKPQSVLDANLFQSS